MHHRVRVAGPRPPQRQAQAPPAGASRHYRTLEGNWPIQPVIGGPGAAGPVLGRELIDARQFGRCGEDRHSSLPWAGGVLSVGSVDTENRGLGALPSV